ncbi:MAG: hydrolase 1, exosortase A system-associated [Parerythrobacter sp.]
MSRLHLAFECRGTTCIGTIDTAPGSAGLLIISGGNEIRSGAFQGQSRLAARIAAAGFPVFRYDRRGVGDSDGENRGYGKSGPDIAAALAAFRAISPQTGRIVTFGNCDAASALMLSGGAGSDAVILANPWTFEEAETSSNPSPLEARARYREKLSSPREIARLLRGGVNFPKLSRGLMQAIKPGRPANSLTDRMLEGLADHAGDVRILLAGNDRSAQAFARAWPADDARIRYCPDASHGFVEPAAQDWLDSQILEALRA